jgi:multidrug efflux pump subunit AcrA (membrane-fusion protein)
MKQTVFREISLKKLSSPEQLDQLIRLTSPKAWLAMVAIGLILACAAMWSYVGSIPTKIEGQGILLNNAGVYPLNADTSGQVTDIRFVSGDMVNKGDVIARIAQPELVEQINCLLDTISTMKENKKETSRKYAQLQLQIEQLREELDYRSRIITPISGRIMELNIQNGSVISQGDTLLTLEQYDSTVRLEAVIYVSAEQGGKIKSGMEAQIIPSIINKEEFGFMEGRVVSVDEYPATEQSMLQTLGNEEMVTMLNGEGVPVRVKIDLITDNQTISGYK